MSAPREFAPAADATTQNRSNPSLKMFAPRAFAPLALRLCTLADPCAISQPRSQEHLPLPIEKIDLSQRYLRTSQLEPLRSARTKTLHIGPRAASIEYLASRHPDDTNDDGSLDGEPSAPKRPRLVSPTRSPPAPSPNYLTLTPSEIDRLLHDTRPFQHWFVYTPDHICGIADDIFRELSAFLSFYAPASEKEAASRIYLYCAFQSHFNRRI
ncbi:hypothetical protein PCASD_20535 [Puccinia coronata f. sp. avenae]|uniref:Uncharacterized protein n=1 Tax=Puccinia coronata f. sp. avenae TaxID=200324 RepID=A0A2N5T126_9BASI|nr:hypothetical protein PCASD_20535 [Puccinia coronata f. sp. avenae]